jgi:hypothetical protein
MTIVIAGPIQHSAARYSRATPRSETPKLLVVSTARQIVGIPRPVPMMQAQALDMNMFLLFSRLSQMIPVKKAEQNPKNETTAAFKTK